MLPRRDSSDWANDGGIFRPVQLLITPKTFVERVEVDATPDLANGDGKISITAYVPSMNIFLDQLVDSFGTLRSIPFTFQVSSIAVASNIKN